MAGCYGWYYVKMDADANTFYLSASQPNVLETPRGPAEYVADFESGLSAGDVVSFDNFYKYDMWATVVAVSGNIVSVDGLPNGAGQTRSVASIRPAPDRYDWSFCCPDRPWAGGVWFGEASYAEGENTAAVAAFSHAEGCDSTAFGQYGHAEGRECEAGYASHAEGRGVKARGQYSHGEGYLTEVSNVVNACAHAEGR